MAFAAAAVIATPPQSVGAHGSDPDVLTVMITIRPDTSDSLDIAAMREREEDWPTEQQRLDLLDDVVTAVLQDGSLRVREILPVGLRYHEVGATAHLGSSIAQTTSDHRWMVSIDTARLLEIAHRHRLVDVLLQVCIDGETLTAQGEPPPDANPDLAYDGCIEWRSPGRTVRLTLTRRGEPGEGGTSSNWLAVSGTVAAVLVVVVSGLTVHAARAARRGRQVSTEDAALAK